MEFLPAELIRKKRFGGVHSRAEIHFLIQGFARAQIPDYQMSAWLMAVCLRGMSAQETTWLTEEMRDSGKVLDLRHLGRTVDKHSTGGVGDKISLLLAPIVAASGVPVPMMAGRGLGHTGGTLDKLESITGFNVRLTFPQFVQQVAAVGAAIMGQTDEICPADRKLYALRDVTGTIDCLPLICGSIMSKKLAEGMAALVLDVKVGSGAFMKTPAEGELLARALMAIGQGAGKKVIAVLSRMDEPLGRFVGNALEVRECLDILSGQECQGEGKTYADTIALTLELAAQMLVLGGQGENLDQARLTAASHLSDGSALRKFEEMCKWQGGDLTQPLPLARRSLPVCADQQGFICYHDVEKLGFAAVLLGAGRRFQNDVLDLAAGIEVFRAQGAAVRAGDTLFTLFAADDERLRQGAALLHESFTLTAKPALQSPLITKVLT